MKLSILSAAALALVGFAASPAFAAQTVHVTLGDDGGNAAMPTNDGMNMGGDMSKSDMKIVADRQTVPSGPVTFDVTNTSPAWVHEMLVVKVADPGEKLPYDPANMVLNEDKLGSLGEVSELDPGKSGTLTLDLSPGTYALLCNQPGHYVAGMWTLLKVS